MLHKIKNMLGTVGSFVLLIVILASQMSLFLVLSAGMNYLGDNIGSYPWLIVVMIFAIIGIALDCLYLEEHVR